METEKVIPADFKPVEDLGCADCYFHQITGCCTDKDADIVEQLDEIYGVCVFSHCYQLKK